MTTKKKKKRKKLSPFPPVRSTESIRLPLLQAPLVRLHWRIYFPNFCSGQSVSAWHRLRETCHFFFAQPFFFFFVTWSISMWQQNLHPIDSVQGWQSLLRNTNTRSKRPPITKCCKLCQNLCEPRAVHFRELSDERRTFWPIVSGFTDGGDACWESLMDLQRFPRTTSSW